MQSAPRLLTALALLAVLGCSKAEPGTPSASRSARRDVITREQIDAMNAADGYDIVQRLRADVLRPRGSASVRSGPDLAVVYVDGVRRGSPEVLRQIRSTEIQEIRFISGTDATTRWGTDHGGGVIDVKTRSGR